MDRLLTCMVLAGVVGWLLGYFCGRLHKFYALVDTINEQQDMMTRHAARSPSENAEQPHQPPETT